MAVDRWNGAGDWNLDAPNWSLSGQPPGPSTDAEI